MKARKGALGKCQRGPSLDALVDAGVVKEGFPKKMSLMVNLERCYLRKKEQLVKPSV